MRVYGSIIEETRSKCKRNLKKMKFVPLISETTPCFFALWETDHFFSKKIKKRDCEFWHFMIYYI